MDAIIQNMVLFNSLIRRCQQRQKGQETLITTHTKLWLPCSQPRSSKTREPGLTERKMEVFSLCPLFVAEAGHYDTSPGHSIQKEEKNKSLCESSLNAHERGRLHVRHVEPPEAVYVTLSCSFPKGQARRRQSSTLCRMEDTLSHLVTASTLSKSWILTA